MSTQSLNDFPAKTIDKVRYGDTDRQGHVNNTVFAQYLETGRVEILYDPAGPLADPGASFVIARLELDFLAELVWPGQVEIGTGVVKVGRSSVTFKASIFQNGRCAATSLAVIVQVDDETKRSTPLNERALARFEQLMLRNA